MAVSFLVIAKEMLEAGDDTFLGHDFSLMFAHDVGDVAVFGIVFEVTSSIRSTMKVSSTSVNGADIVVGPIGIFGKELTALFNKFSVEGCTGHRFRDVESIVSL